MKSDDKRPDVIELKCWPVSFQALKNGLKRFEYRKDDRPYEVGKTILQREWDPDIEEYTGEELYHDITFIIRGGIFGIPEGYCIFSVTEPWTTLPNSLTNDHIIALETCVAFIEMFYNPGGKLKMADEAIKIIRSSQK